MEKQEQKLYPASPGEGLVIQDQIWMVAEQILFWVNEH